ncbi:MAG: hypothetical protein CSA96_05220 [Bacteroidetes bacterium]|nr:MAG: hypothetical protein CSA96_05220 [Bacteroidota bacterium]
MPLVSIIVTLYNRKAFIKQAIESILDSDFQDWELIIVDDCSSDGSANIAQSFEGRDPRIRVFINEQNLGQFENRNYAASLACGTYIKFIDSDDLIYPHGIGTMVRAMEAYPSCGIGFDDEHYDGSSAFPHCYSPERIFEKHYFERGMLFVGPLGSIYRRSLFEELGGFDPACGVAADYDFNLRAAARKDVVVFQRDLYWYRRHEGQELVQKAADYFRLSFSINRSILTGSDCPMNSRAARLALDNIYLLNMRKALFRALKMQLGTALSMIRFMNPPLRLYFLVFFPYRMRRKLKL